GSEIEHAARAGKSVVSGGVVNHLRIIKAEAAAQDGLAGIAPIVGKAHTGREVLVRISESLALVPQAKIHGEARSETQIILCKQRPQCVVNGVTGSTITLGVAANVGDVVKKSRTFANCERLSASVVLELSQKD